MKKMIIAALAITLIASTAFAANSGKLTSTTKVQIEKETAIDANKGLLDCSGAIEVALDNSYAGDNTGAANNVATYGCSTWNEAGGEVVYHIFFAAPTMFTADIVSVCDLDLAVLDGCDEALNCLIVVDSGVQTNSPVSGDFYFVVDGYAGAECAFTFNINSVTPPPPASFCDLVQDVTGNYFTGDTCTGVNNVSALGCEDYSEAGLEQYYEIFMPAGSSFTADVTNTADGALWVLDSCSDPLGCLAYADATFGGDMESVSYTNASGVDMTVILVVDSWGAGSCGTYTMDFTSTGGAVATESMSFGAAKAMFR